MQNESNSYISIVVPAYNEAARLPSSLRKMAEHFRQWTFSFEVLVIVEHSTDGTLELALQATAKQANFQVADNKVHRGKGYAVRSGMLRTRGEFVFYMDADLSVPLEEISRFVAYFEAHPEVDVLFGNRRHPDSQIELRQTPLREKMG